jgi:CheY-like chemotaxis protein
MRQILTVDDSASVRQMVSFTLRKAGYEVTEAVDGQDALGKISKAKFDLIITDRGPQNDGLRVRADSHADHRIAGGEKGRGTQGGSDGLDREAF